MKKPCGAPTRVAQLHPSIRIGGIVTETCPRECVPLMTVCEFHATPEAMRMVIEQLYARAKR